MGVTITMLSIVVLIPLASLVVYSSQLGLREFFEVITRKRVLSSFYVSFITALGASLVNAVMGLILAWVLVRYEFPGKRIMDGMIELPFALPTAVAGISLTSLTSDQGLIGSFFAIFFEELFFRNFFLRFLPVRDWHSDAALENTEALYLSQETDLTRPRSHHSSSCQNFRSLTTKAQLRSLSSC